LAGLAFAARAANPNDEADEDDEEEHGNRGGIGRAGSNRARIVLDHTRRVPIVDDQKMTAYAEAKEHERSDRGGRESEAESKSSSKVDQPPHHAPR
jgi:hypothetical protein